MDKLPLLKQYLQTKYPTLKYATLYGSHVYGTATEHSDLDLIVVIIDNKSIGDSFADYDSQIGNIDISLYDEVEFIKQIKQNDVKPLEAIFVKQQYIIFGNVLQYKNDFVCYYPNIRHTFGKVARMAWNKGCKKLTKKIDPNEIKRGKKSLYHSLRVFLFALNLYNTNKIDFEDAYLGELNKLYFEIINEPVNEIIINGKIKPEYQELFEYWDKKFKQIPNEEQYKQICNKKKT